MSAGVLTKKRSSARVSWSSDDGGIPASYQLQLSSDGLNWGAIVSATSTSYEFSGLSPSSNYWVRVLGQNDAGSSASYLGFTFQTLPLAAPQNLRVVARGVGSVSLAWDYPLGAGETIDDFKIFYSTDGVGWAPFDDGVSQAANATVTGLVTGQNYFFKAVAVLNGVESGSTGSTEPGRVQDIVAMGGSHVCVISGGRVECWGSNSAGQLGDGSTVSRSSGATVGLVGPVQVGAGGSHTCAVVNSGEVYCWGSNSFGQLGDGTDVNRLTPVRVMGITNAQSVSLGNEHSCAVLLGGAVKCWGQNSSGQLGTSANSDSKTPQLVQGYSDIRVVRSGFYHTCALTNSGAVGCWGSNGAGQSGGNHLANLGVAEDVATQGDFTCALLRDTTVWCWGWNNGRQISPLSATVISTPTKLAWATGAINIDTGNDHLCAVFESGVVKCVGWNTVGQLGDGTTTNRTTPVTVSNLPASKMVFAGGAGWGDDFTCAVTNQHKLYCWGSNQKRQIAHPSTDNFRTPQLIQTLDLSIPVWTSANPAETPSGLNLSLTAKPSEIYASIQVSNDGGMPVECRFVISSNAMTVAETIFSQDLAFSFVKLKPQTSYLVQAECRNGVGLSATLPSVSISTPSLYAFGTLKRPVISGTKYSGRTLTAKLGTVVNGSAVSYSWRINGKSVRNNANSTFVVPAKSKGKSISVIVTYAMINYKTVMSSSLSSKITR